MNVVRMIRSNGACCMTAEMHSFTVLDNNWLERQKRYYPKTDTAGLFRLAFGMDCTQLLRNKRQYLNNYFFGLGDTVEEAWQNALAEVQASVNHFAYAGKQVRYFWFVRREGQDTYDNEELRGIVQKLPNVVSMGNYVNANSCNEVDGYLVVFTNESGGSSCEDEDEDNE